MASFMKINQHPVERILRTGLGLALIAMAATGTIGVWGYLGLVPLATGLVGNCPLYSLLGISTCPAPKKTA